MNTFEGTRNVFGSTNEGSAQENNKNYSEILNSVRMDTRA